MQIGGSTRFGIFRRQFRMTKRSHSSLTRLQISSSPDHHRSPHNQHNDYSTTHSSTVPNELISDPKPPQSAAEDTPCPIQPTPLPFQSPLLSITLMSSFAQSPRSNRMVMNMAHSFDGHVHMESLMWHIEDQDDLVECCKRHLLDGQSGKQHRHQHFFSKQDPGATLSASLSRMDGFNRRNARPNTSFFASQPVLMNPSVARARVNRASQSLPQLPTMTTINAPTAADSWASSSEDLSNGDVSTAPTSPVSIAASKDDLGGVPMFPALDAREESRAVGVPLFANAEEEEHGSYQESLKGFVPAAGENAKHDAEADGDSEEEDSENESEWESAEEEQDFDVEDGIFEYHEYEEQISIVFGYSDDEDNASGTSSDEDEDDDSDSDFNSECSDDEDGGVSFGYDSDEEDIFSRSLPRSPLPAPHRRPTPLISCLSSGSTSGASSPNKKSGSPRTVRFSEAKPAVIHSRTYVFASYDLECFLKSNECPEEIKNVYCCGQTEMERMMSLEEVKRHFAEMLNFGEEETKRFCNNNYFLGKVEFEQISKDMEEEEKRARAEKESEKSVEKAAERKVENAVEQKSDIQKSVQEVLPIKKHAYVSDEHEDDGWVTETD